MRKIFLDTNFLMIPGRLGVDIFGELARLADFPFEPCVLEGTLRELRGIASSGGKGADRRAAKLGLELVEARGVTVVRGSSGVVDDAILAEAEASRAIVATQDAELKRRVRAKGLPLVVLRQRNHLEFVGWVKR
jgi:rRNA-processing protein FCF1